MIDFKKYLKTKFKSGGRNIETGVDCYGLVKILMKDVYNIDIDEYSNYELDEVDEIFACEHSRYLSGKTNWIKTTSENSHILLIKTNGIIDHIGFMIDSKRFIHITENGNVRIDSIDSPIWKNKIEGFYRWSK